MEVKEKESPEEKEMPKEKEMNPLLIPPKKSHKSKELTNTGQESISYGDFPSASWTGVIDGSAYTGYVGYKDYIYAIGISDNVISSYDVNLPAWVQDSSLATAAVIGVSETKIYSIAVNRLGIYEKDPSNPTNPWSLIWHGIPDRLEAQNLIIGGVSIYCIVSEGSSLSIQRYDDASEDWVIMTVPSNLTFDYTKFIGVSTYLVGLTTSGVPYIRGPNASDTWESIGTSIYSYLFGGGKGSNTIYLATYPYNDPPAPSDCYLYNFDTGLNYLGPVTVGMNGAYPPLYVSMTSSPAYYPSIIAISTVTVDSNTYLWIPFSGAWYSITSIPTTQPFQVILPGGNLPNFCIGYADSNYWFLMPNPVSESNNKPEAEMSMK